MSEFPNTRWTVIEAARAGDEEAFRSFLEHYQGAVKSYLRAHVPSDDVDDLTQDVFLRFFRDAMAGATPARGRFRGLVLTVSRNVLRDAQRRAMAKKRGGGKVVPLGDLDVEGGVDEREEFDREWVGNLLRHALARLKCKHADYYQAIRMFYFEQRPQAEIAQAMGKPVSRVKHCVYQGKRKLIAYLKEEVMTYCASEAEYEDELGVLARFFPL